MPTACTSAAAPGREAPTAGPPNFGLELGELHAEAATVAAARTRSSFRITAIARDNRTGNLYAATDFGVLELRAGKRVWRQAASGLPPVAVYNLALSIQGRVLYAGSHGRSIYKLDLSGDSENNGGG